MNKLLVIMSLLFSMYNSDYVGVESIEYYQSDKEIKEFNFHFISDNYKAHEVKVEMDFYDENNECLATYHSTLTIVGNVSKKAEIEYEYTSDKYVLIYLLYDDKYVVNDARINLYSKSSCYYDNKTCTNIYKSEYSSGYSRDFPINFNVRNMLNNGYLKTNKFDLKKLKIESDYDFKNSEIYLINNSDAVEYKTDVFSLDVKASDDYYEFSFLDNYFINYQDFNYKDSYEIGMSKTNSLYFPYSDDYHEYKLSLVIEDFVTIKYDFTLVTFGKLFGDCSNSKYCLGRETI